MLASTVFRQLSLRAKVNKCSCTAIASSLTDLTISRRLSHGFARKLPTFEDDKEEIFNFSPSPDAKNALERYHELRERALLGGGPKGIERHVKKNKKVLIRERINALLDPGSPFLEIGDLAGFEMDYGDVPMAGVVAGNFV